jgi:hypothetical protein
VHTFVLVRDSMRDVLSRMLPVEEARAAISSASRPASCTLNCRPQRARVNQGRGGGGGRGSFVVQGESTMKSTVPKGPPFQKHHLNRVRIDLTSSSRRSCSLFCFSSSGCSNCSVTPSSCPSSPLRVTAKLTSATMEDAEGGRIGCGKKQNAIGQGQDRTRK